MTDPTGYPIPTDEDEFAEDERRAIIEFDGDGGEATEESIGGKDQRKGQNMMDGIGRGRKTDSRQN